MILFVHAHAPFFLRAAPNEADLRSFIAEVDPEKTGFVDLIKVEECALKMYHSTQRCWD